MTAQSVGAHGLHKEPHGLTAWDPERYNSLNIPDENIAYDIFNQAVQSVSKDRSLEQIDPLDGLNVKREVAIGYSQAGTKLRTYANAVHPVDPILDGIMLLVSGGFSSGFSKLQFADDPQIQPIPCIIREDLDIPVFAINSELEALMMQKIRQANSEKYCCWEVTGTAHLSKEGVYLSKDRAQLNGLHSMFLDILMHSSEFMNSSWLELLDSALILLNKWIDYKITPPSFEPIQVNEKGQFIRDQNGNALGGVKLPTIEVPIAAYDGTAKGYGGIEKPFTKEKLTDMYTDQKEYIAKVTQSAQKAYKQGLISKWQEQQYLNGAKLTQIFK